MAAGAEIVLQGFFVLRKPEEDNKKVKIKEENVKLAFASPEEGKASFPVTGGGSNKFGNFNVKGAYDPASGRLQVNPPPPLPKRSSIIRPPLSHPLPMPRAVLRELTRPLFVA